MGIFQWARQRKSNGGVDAPRRASTYGQTQLGRRRHGNHLAAELLEERNLLAIITGTPGPHSESGTDAFGSSFWGITPTPDFLSAAATVSQDSVTFTVQYAPGSIPAINPDTGLGRTYTSILLDLDRDTSTGFAGIDSGHNDANLLGYDLSINFGSDRSTASLYDPLLFQSLGGVPVSRTGDTFTVTVPFAKLGGDGDLNFKLLNSAQIDSTSSTSVLDYLPNVGLSPIATVGGSGPQVPVGDFAEGNAAAWTAFPAGVSSVTNSTAQVKVGSQSVLFSTSSADDAGVTLTAPAGGWDLSTSRFFSFSELASNNNPNRFEGKQPIIVLKGPGGSFQYTPVETQMLTNNWRQFYVPLAGDTIWQRTVTGSPSLANITSLEIHQNGYGGSYTVVYDGVQFIPTSVITTFQIDPDMSSITLSGNVTVNNASFNILSQGPAGLGLTAAYAGQINAIIDNLAAPTSIAFPGGSVLDALPTGNWQPNIGGTPGNALADYGARVSILSQQYFAIRNFQTDLTSEPLPIDGNGQFSSNSEIISIINGTSDINAPILGVQESVSNIGGFAYNAAVTPSSLLQVSPGTWRLTVPAGGTIPIDLDGDDITDVNLNLAGTIVAKIAPDLTADTLTAPTTAQRGQPIQVGWTVRNSPTAVAASASWSDRVYLSIDSTLSADDVILDTVAGSTLTPGANYSRSRQIVLPESGIAAGNYYLLVKSDSNLGQEELTESNNIVAKAIAIDGAEPFTVTNTNDSGIGSLRQAILNANAAAHPVTISFAIPATDANFVDVDAAIPGGDAAADVFRIRPLSALPPINNTLGNPITIDATTQYTATAGALAYTGGIYSENFDTLPASGGGSVVGRGPSFVSSSWSGATRLVGWQIANPTGSSTNTEYLAQDGSLGGSSGRGITSFGSSGTSDRSLGTLSTSNQIPTFGLVLTNSSSQPLTSFTLSYTGEQWRRGDTLTPNSLEFSWGLGSDLGGTFTPVPALNFTSPTGGDINLALDGNLSVNQSARSATISGINWGVGQTLVLKWTSQELSGQDDGLAIDNLVFSASPDPSSPVPNVDGNSNPFGPEIVLDGSLAGNVFAALQADSPATIRGLAVHSFSTSGAAIVANTSATIDGNYLGTDPTGRVALPNSTGIAVLGGVATVTNNLISGNVGYGLRLATDLAVTVIGNKIGTDASGTAAIGNQGGGIWVSGINPANMIGGVLPGQGNVVAFNGGAGLDVVGANTLVSIRGNSIFQNATLGIDLNADGPTLNDSFLDTDTGPNGLQNYPTLSNVLAGDSTTIRGSISGDFSASTKTIDFFASSTTSSPGSNGGRRYLGSTTISNVILNASFTVTLPVATAPGEFITATTTSSEGTSEFSPALAAGVVDLVVSDISAPSSILAGQFVNVSWTVANLGNSATIGTISDHVYLSTDPVLDVGTDIDLGTTSSSVSIAAGGTSVHSKLVTIPSNLVGPFYLIVRIDDTNAIVELGAGAEANNVAVDDVPIVVTLPDLKVDQASAPGAVAIGQTFDFSYLIANLGDGEAGFHADSVYLSNNATWELTDLLLDTQFSSNVAAATQSTVTRQLTIPTNQGLASGTYYLIVKTDSSNSLLEHDETNNVASTSLFVSNVPLYTVTNTNDSGVGSLRQAILNANVALAAVTIDFKIPDTDAGFVDVDSSFANGDAAADAYVIKPLTALPTLNNATGQSITIDARTQSYFGGSTNPLGPEIVLDGELLGNSGASGFIVASPATIRGFAIGNFSDSGIDVVASTITIDGNYIGTDATGSLDRGNLTRGVRIQNSAGGTVSNNLISGNGGGNVAAFGILIESSGETTINGNKIGTDATGTAALGNTNTGIYVNGTGNAHVTIGSQFLGLGNTIAFNQGSGVAVVQSTRTEIAGNSIFSNLGLGIDLLSDGLTPNDPLDADSGPNGRQNFPELASVVTSQSTTVSGSLSSKPNTSYQIHFYANSAPDDSGYGEGQRSLGSLFVTTNASGSATFTNGFLGATSSSDWITATATGPEGTSEFSQAIRQPTTDLVVGSITAAATAIAGQMVEVSWNLTNLGPNAVTSSWSDRIYLSNDNLVGGDIDLGTLNFNGTIAVGQSITQTKLVSIPANIKGSYYFVIKTDDGNSVFEGEGETNNLSIDDVPTEFLGADLVISSVTSPLTALAGQTVPVSWTYTNHGTAPAVGTWVDRIYISSDDAIGGDAQIDSLSFTGTLQPGQSITRTKNVTIPDSAQGQRYIVVALDANNAINEPGGEANNSAINASGTFVQKADLTVTGVTVQGTPKFGDQVPVQWSVANIGDAAAGGQWTDRIYFSTDGFLSDNDLLLSNFVRPAEAAALQPGGTNLLNGTVMLPLDVNYSPGGYYLLVATDASSAVLESNDNNNVKSQQLALDLPPLPDLTVTTITPHTLSTFAGWQVEVSWTIVNNGPGAATGTWNDRVFVSSNNSIGADTVVGNFPVTATIPAGQSRTRTQVITLPQDFAGELYVVVQTDQDGGAFEYTATENNFGIATSPIVVAIPPSPNLQVSSIVPPEQAFSSKSTVVEWKVKNVGTAPTSSPLWSDAVYLSADSIFDDSDIFLGSATNSSYLNVGQEYSNSLTVQLPRGIGGDYYFVVKTDNSNQVSEYQAEGDNVQVAEPTFVELTQAPNLQINSVSAAPLVALTGDAVTVNWSVTNEGFGPPLPNEQSWYDDIYLSSDNQLDATDVLLGRRSHAGGLLPAASYQAAQVITLPNVDEGEYYILVKTDAGNQVFENIDESDNLAAAGEAIDVLLTSPPDLVVSQVEVPEMALASHVLEVNYQITNIAGSPTAKSFWTDSFFLSADTTLDANDLPLGVRSHYGVLAANESYSGTAGFQLPSGMSGDFYVLVTTDSGLMLAEVTESNNNASSTSSVMVESLPADLVVSSFSVSATAEAGGSVLVQWAISNQGTGDTLAAGWWDQLIASTDAILGNADDVLLGSFRRSGSLDPLQPPYTNNAVVTLPIRFSGSYQLFLRTDSSNEVFEDTNEGNNASLGVPLTVTQTLADLQITAASATDAVLQGGDIIVSWTVKNVGPGTTNSTYWNDYIYLSPDPTIGDGNDFSLGAQQHSAPLAPGAEYSASRTVKLPNNISGSFYIVVLTDGGNLVYETPFENNNARATTSSAQPGSPPLVITPIEEAPVRPDLIISVIDAPFEAVSSQTFALSWTVANQGDSTGSRNWYDAVYLSRDQILDRSTDLYLGYVDHNGGLAAGASYSQNASFAIPSGYAGPYFVIVVTDSGAQLVEPGGEQNNIDFDAQPLQVALAPPTDLVVGTIVVPPTGAPGFSAAITYTVINQGANSAVGSWFDSVYLSSDDHWDVDDKLFGRVQHFQSGPLVSGAHYTTTLSSNVPGLLPGNYRVIIRTDIRNNIPEGNEENNIGASLDNVALDVQLLALSPPEPQPPLSISGSLSEGQEAYYRVEVPAGETLLINFDGDSPTASNELYIRYGQIPTRGQFDYSYSAPFLPDQQVVVPTTQAGTYYILAYADSLATPNESYTIDARLLQFGIRSVSTDKGSASASVTTLITGAKFSADTTVTLKSDEGVEFLASSVLFVDATRIYATFNLLDARPGQYDVRIDDGVSSFVRTDGFEVLSSGAGALTTELIKSDAVRPDKTFETRILFGNNGLADLFAPILIVESLDGVPIALTPDGLGAGQTLVQSMAQERGAPAAVLRPNGRGSFSIFSHSPLTAQTLHFRLATLDATNTAIDWDTIREQFDNPVSNAQWFDGFWSNIVAQLGTSQAELLAAIAARQERLRSFGLQNDLASAWDNVLADAAYAAIPAIALTPAPTGFALWGATGIDSSATLDPSKPTFVIIHDFRESKLTGWVADTAAALRQQQPLANIVIVDWSDRALGQPYDVASAAMRDVGTDVAQFLSGAGVSGADVHLIGAGLGAQAAGFAGQDYRLLMGNALGRITALNPAGANFRGESNAQDHLDASDATFVDVIHTSSWLGDGRAAGTVDFYADDLPSNTLLAAHEFARQIFVRSLQGFEYFAGDGSPVGWPASSVVAGSLNFDATPGSVGLPTLDTFAGNEPPLPVWIPEQPIASEWQIDVLVPIDPNDILGPSSFSEENWVSATVPLMFTIRFENLKQATGPVQSLEISQELDPDLDATSFRIGDYTVGQYYRDLPGTASSLSETISFPEKGYQLRVVGSVNVNTRVVTFRISATDLNGNPLPPNVGFLPPNTDGKSGLGQFQYTIQAKSTVNTGTKVFSSARVIFDREEPITTPTIFNTVDTVEPQSGVQPLGPTQANSSFLVRWAGQDDTGGSALRDYTVYVWDTGKGPTVWLANTQLTEAMYAGVPGHSYAFQAVSRDNVNNAMKPPAPIDPPATAQALTAIPTPAPPRVSAVLVNGGGTCSSGWSNTFRSYLADAGLGVGGYQIPLGANQEKSLPWTKINEIQIVFNEDVVVDQGDLVVTGVKVPTYAISGFKYDPATFKATWTLASPITTADRITVRLDGHSPGAVLDRLNVTLDGEFRNGIDTISGNGTAGGDFVFNINVVPGDGDNNGGVNFTDYLKVRSSVGTGKPGYLVMRDIDANGGINFTDVLLARARVGNQLPKAPATGSLPDKSRIGESLPIAFVTDAFFGALGANSVATSAASVPEVEVGESIAADAISPAPAVSAIYFAASSSDGSASETTKASGPALDLSPGLARLNPMSLSDAPANTAPATASNSAQAVPPNSPAKSREFAAVANWLAARRVELAWAASVDRLLADQGSALESAWHADEIGPMIGKQARRR